MGWQKYTKAKKKDKWQRLKGKKQLKGKCQPLFQTFQSENNLLEYHWGYTVAHQPHKKNQSS